MYFKNVISYCPLTLEHHEMFDLFDVMLDTASVMVNDHIGLEHPQMHDPVRILAP